jgi:hypothetical protein
MDATSKDDQHYRQTLRLLGKSSTAGQIVFTHYHRVLSRHLSTCGQVIPPEVIDNMVLELMGADLNHYLPEPDVGDSPLPNLRLSLHLVIDYSAVRVPYSCMLAANHDYECKYPLAYPDTEKKRQYALSRVRKLISRR